MEQARPQDADRESWVEHAPPRIRPYLRLARFDRPVGAWLLFWPCAWGLALEALASGHAFPSPWYLLLFLIGAFVMRGAGCTYNDIVDRDFDAQVERTRNRPIPAGLVTVPQAFAFAIGLSLIGFFVLIQFNTFAVLLGIASLGVVALYPFAKRVTDWPQAVLGLAFNWGALMGWAAEQASLALPALLLYAGGIAWTIGYDTIYAHQDRDDDAVVGVRSTARLFGRQTKAWLTLVYAVAALLFAAAAWTASGSALAGSLALGAALHFAWQIAKLDTANGALCLRLFKSNHAFGALLFVALALAALLIA